MVESVSRKIRRQDYYFVNGNLELLYLEEAEDRKAGGERILDCSDCIRGLWSIIRDKADRRQ